MQIQNTIDAIRLLFRKDKELYRSFFQILGFYPHNISVYREAVMHKSLGYKGEEGKYVNNERLEYLGDAVLETVVSDILYRHFPNKKEGFLTTARSKMVQRETLGKVAKHIGLDKLIQHHNTTQSHNSYIGGNAFEALIGAIYLDRGFAHCQQFISKRVIGVAMDLEKTAYVEVNFKSRLLELCQKYRLRAEFPLISETRDEKGAPYFHSCVCIEDVELGDGKGYSKRESQQQACKATLNMFKKNPNRLTELVLKAENKIQDTQTES